MNLDKLVGKQVYYVLNQKERKWIENKHLPVIFKGILKKDRTYIGYSYSVSPGPHRNPWYIEPKYVSLNKFELLVKVKLGWL